MVNATDLDSDKNARIRYALVTPIAGFSVGESTGVVYVNTSRLVKPIKNDIQLSISATDSGVPPLSAVSTVRIHVNVNGYAKPQFMQNHFRYVNLAFILVAKHKLFVLCKRPFNSRGDFLLFQLYHRWECSSWNGRI